MATVDPQPLFHLHFEGEGTLGHKVPGTALVQAVQALQRSIYLLAMAYEGQELKQRVRVSREMEHKYALIFSIPEEGSYDLPYHVGNTAATLFDPNDVALVTEQHRNVLSAIQAGDVHALRRAVPSAAYRRLIVSEFKRMQPPPRTGMVVSIEDYRRTKLLDGKTVANKLASFLHDATPLIVHPQLVTGRLDALDFQSRTLRLQLSSGRILNGTYSDDFEPVLLENPREFIQVRGEAVLSEDGTLKQLNNVQEIIEIDTTPLVVEKVSGAGFSLVAQHAVAFDVSFDPEDEFYVASGPFQIFATGADRDELEQEIAQSIRFLWVEYVHADAKILTEDALVLRQELTEAFAEVVDAD